MGVVNGANSFISILSVLANGNYANHSVNIKNLLEYNKSYADSVATNEFYFLDTSRSANKNRFTRRNVTDRQDGAMIYGNMNKESYWSCQEEKVQNFRLFFKTEQRSFEG